MALSYEYIQFLNEKVREYLPMNRRKMGDRWNFRCPICGDSHKSSRKMRGWWYEKTATYYCFNCGAALSGIKFLEAVSGQDYASLKQEFVKLFLKSGLSTSLSAAYDIGSSEPNMFNLERVVKPEWKNPLSEKARQYLTDRLVSDAPFLAEPLYSWTSKTNEEYILIPWKVNGVDAYFQLNDFQKLHDLKYIFPKERKKLIYGLDNIDMSWPYIIAFEGVYDSLFVPNGIALGTKAITEYQLNLIKERYPKHQIVISFDNDEAGFESMERLLKRNNDFKYFRWFNKNTNEKDINEYVIAKGDVNIFADRAKVERMIVDKLSMKMFMLQHKI